MDATWLRIYSIARKVHNNHHLAEDAVQEAMLRMVSLPEQPTKPASWLSVAAVNYLRDQAKGGYCRRRKDLNLEEVIVEYPDQLVQREECGAVRAALRKLPLQDRHLLRDAYFNELSHDKLCAKYGVNRTTLYMRLSRARQRFRKTFKCLHTK